MDEKHSHIPLFFMVKQFSPLNENGNICSVVTNEHCQITENIVQMAFVLNFYICCCPQIVAATMFCSALSHCISGS